MQKIQKNLLWGFTVKCVSAFQWKMNNTVYPNLPGWQHISMWTAHSKTSFFNARLSLFFPSVTQVLSSHMQTGYLKSLRKKKSIWLANVWSSSPPNVHTLWWHFITQKKIWKQEGNVYKIKCWNSWFHNRISVVYS